LTKLIVRRGSGFAFATATDDARAVIAFIHDNEAPE
jgi:hypothetical protein